MKTLRRYKHAILLAALLCVALVESFSHRQVLGPVLSDVAITMMLLLVFVIVFEGWLNRLVAFVALAIAVAAVWGHNVLASELSSGTTSVGLSQRGASAGRFRDPRDPAKYLRAAHCPNR